MLEPVPGCEGTHSQDFDDQQGHAEGEGLKNSLVIFHEVHFQQEMCPKFTKLHTKQKEPSMETTLKCLKGDL